MNNECTWIAYGTSFDWQQEYCKKEFVWELKDHKGKVWARLCDEHFTAFSNKLAPSGFNLDKLIVAHDCAHRGMM